MRPPLAWAAGRTSHLLLQVRVSMTKTRHHTYNQNIQPHSSHEILLLVLLVHPCCGLSVARDQAAHSLGATPARIRVHPPIAVNPVAAYRVLFLHLHKLHQTTPPESANLQ